MADELVCPKMVLGRDPQLMLSRPNLQKRQPRDVRRSDVRRATLDLQSQTFDSLRVSHVITSTTAG